MHDAAYCDNWFLRCNISLHIKYNNVKYCIQVNWYNLNQICILIFYQIENKTTCCNRSYTYYMTCPWSLIITCCNRSYTYYMTCPWSLIVMSEWVLYNVNSATFSYIMARTIRWWWGLLCTRTTRFGGFFVSTSSLKQ
jgi:hypothetical protein